MIINDKYSGCFNITQTYSNEIFLALQIWQLQHVFCSEISAIKNPQLEFLAFSNEYAEAFHLSQEALGKKIKDIKIVSQAMCKEIETQELNIIATGKSEDHLFHFTYGKQYTSYIMRKWPLINPATNDIVGILILATKFDVLQSRRLFLNYMLRKVYKAQQASDMRLTEQQRQIVACLLLGFHSRKEIALLLSGITNTYHSEIRIRSELHTLYQQLNCNNIGELLNLIAVAEGMQLNIPGVIVPDGSLKIEKP